MPNGVAHASSRSVLMVVHSTFPAIGGAEIQAARLSSVLLRRQWNVQVIALYGPPVTDPDPAFSQVPVVRIAGPAIPGVAGAVLILRLTYELFRRRHTYSVVHLHIVKSLAFVATIVGHWLGKKVVLKVSGYDELDHGILSERGSRSIRFRIMNWGCRKADVVVAISRHVERRLRALGYREQQIVYLPNGVDTVRFGPGPNRRQRDAIENSSPAALFVGRFSSQKGLYDLLEAWVTVHKEFPNATLRLVGDGALRPGLEALVRAEPALRGTVVFAGTSNHVEEHYAATDCYVCSSHSEGLSNTMLEAMAAGLPIVSTRVSGAEDLVENGKNGFLVPICDPQALAEGISQIFREPERARILGMNSRAVALQVFDMERVADKYEDIYSH
jgi:glycosyltransferase involved in cell wall biosynthesis